MPAIHADRFPDLFEPFTRTVHFPEKVLRAVESRLSEKNGKPYLKCVVRGKEVMARPEEVFRQLWLELLTTKYKYPASRLQFESPITFGRGGPGDGDAGIFQYVEISALRSDGTATAENVPCDEAPAAPPPTPCCCKPGALWRQRSMRGRGRRCNY